MEGKKNKEMTAPNVKFANTRIKEVTNVVRYGRHKTRSTEEITIE
jgi:hypothetical protein